MGKAGAPAEEPDAMAQFDPSYDAMAQFDPSYDALAQFDPAHDALAAFDPETDGGEPALAAAGGVETELVITVPLDCRPDVGIAVTVFVHPPPTPLPCGAGVSGRWDMGTAKVTMSVSATIAVTAAPASAGPDAPKAGTFRDVKIGDKRLRL